MKATVKYIFIFCNVSINAGPKNGNQTFWFKIKKTTIQYNYRRASQAKFDDNPKNSKMWKKMKKNRRLGKGEKIGSPKTVHAQGGW